MMGRAKECDLAHCARDEQFAAAMLLCQNASGDCSVQGRCILGGCFATGPEMDAARMIEAIIPKDGRAGVELAYLRACVKLLRAGRVML